jgi:hypothetical protein
MIRTILWTLTAIALLALAGCRGEQTEDQAAAWQQKASQVAEQATTMPAGRGDAAEGPAGKILETMNSGGYTYVKLETDQGEIWAAGPETEGLQVGDQVVLAGAMLMKDFQAKSLDRTFDQIYFASGIHRPGEATAAEVQDAVASAHANLVVNDAGVDFSGLTVPDGGVRIADIHGRKAELSGKTVLFRGKVVKYTPAVMGKNWLHVQDGSAEGAAGDITVTTTASAQVGQTVLVRGTLAVDKDFGAGYRYDVIVEDADVTVE